MNSFKSTEIFGLREFETFQPNEVFCTVKTTCRKDAGLSAARWGMPIFQSLIMYDIPLINGVSEML